MKGELLPHCMALLLPSKNFYPHLKNEAKVNPSFNQIILKPGKLYCEVEYVQE